MRTSSGSLASFLAAGILAGLSWSAPPAEAQVDTVEVWPGTLGVPVVASVPLGDLLPLYGAVHVAYTRDRALRHAWKWPDPWQIETVADSALSYDIAARGDGLAVLAFADGSGRLICGERTPTQWELDTLAAYPGSTLRVSLALNPGPAIAFLETPPGGPSRLRYARRDGTTWNLSELDPDVGAGYSPSIAIDHLGRPNVAYVRSAATSVGFELVLLEGASENGPFTPTVVDTEGVGPVALAWDRTRHRPFVNYRGMHWDTFDSEYRVTYRDNSGDWPWQTIGEPLGSGIEAAVSLALDPLGALGAAWLSLIPIAPHLGQEHETNVCGFVETGRVILSRQPAGVPSGAFEHGQMPQAFGPDAVCSGRAVSSHSPGTFDVCWRAPRINCAPFAVLYSEVSGGSTSVPPRTGPALASLELSPSPRRGAAPLRLRWSQPRVAEARFELHDVAGRVLASHRAGELPAGRHELAWATPALPPGLYWVALRLDGEPAATKVLVHR